MGKATAQQGAHVVKDGIRHKDVYATAVGDTTKAYYVQKYRCEKCVMLIIVIVSIFPQQRKLMGSSAQISSGVCRCGSQEQVPEESSGRFRRVPV